MVNEKEDSLLNVRAGGSKSSKITDQLPNGHLIYCLEDKTNWTNIDYTKKGKERNGYIYKDRYKFVSVFPALTISGKTSDSISLKRDTIEVTITKSKFNRQKHKFRYVKDAPSQIELIDQEKYWGTDGGIPQTQFEKIRIKIGQKQFSLPRAALKGLYEPDIYSAEANYDKANEILYIHTMNSDGAGSYEVIWKIVKGVYMERLLAYGF